MATAQITDQLRSLYRDLLGRDADQAGLDYWGSEISKGIPISAVANTFKQSPEYQSHQAQMQMAQQGVTQPGGTGPAYQQAAGANSSQPSNSMFGMTPNTAGSIQPFQPSTQQVQNSQTQADRIMSGAQQSLNTLLGPNPTSAAYAPQTGGASQVQTQQGSFPTGPNGIPDYYQLAQLQQQQNLQNAREQAQLNNPNIYGPGGSQTRTVGPDGTISINQTLNPQLQANYDAYNTLQNHLINQTGALSNNKFSLEQFGAVPQLDTSGVSGIPGADANNLAAVRDAMYQQQTQYLDPQFQQAEEGLRNQLVNQGLAPGSEAYQKAMDNFALQKQRAYGDARNSAIQAGGQEQSRLFGIGLQSNQAGMNNALAQFNTGLQGRQQGVSEAQTEYTLPLNALASLRSGGQVQLPNYPGQAGVTIPGVDYMNAGNAQFNATRDLNNANNASSQANWNGIFNLGQSLIQSGALNGPINSIFGIT